MHLHLHSEYSLLDGACVIKRLIPRLKELGMTAAAITDHGSMCGAVEFYKECKANGIKPIIGCEVYVANRSRTSKAYKLDYSNHLILLCENKIGYQNLIKMVSDSYIDGFYNKPRVDHELLKAHHEGLICLSACLAGEIPQALVNGDYAKAKETAEFYRDTFGKDNYFIEIQDHDIPEQQRILPYLVRLADELDIPLVCTNDCHYIEREDSKSQALLMCIQTNTIYGQENNLELPTDEFYVKSYDEMAEKFSKYEGALENTVKIAQRCNFDFEFGVTKLPLFVIDGVSDNTEYFEKLCRDGLKFRYGENPPDEYGKRMDYEISVIEKMGYVDYFLIVWDFVHYAKSHDIPVGPGRGSGAGSICSYAIGITGIDPMRFNLLFERFLNPERVTMPDFDIDFCVEKRQLVIDYVISKYGSDHVAQIVTFGTMAAKAVVRDVGRALGMSYQEVDVIAKLIPSTLNITIDKALMVSKDLKTLYDTNERGHDLIDMARKLEGMPRHASTHAAGVVITRDTVSSYVPLQKNDEAIVTQYTMNALEELGLLKMDFLGLRNLTVIDRCVKKIQKADKDFSIENIPLDDKAVYAMLSNGDTIGVFQLESAGMKRVISQLKPTSIEDIIAVISLYRPGPMDSIPKYIESRHNQEKATYLHPLLKPILDVTYGCIVYQEQVMQICRELAGYSYGRADLVRRAMAKKKADVMEEERHNFIYGKVNDDGSIECTGCVKNGVDEKIANTIFNEMSSFAAYAFNKSHATAYAFVAYQTAYLKLHYFKEYMAALLTSVLGSTDKIIEYSEECSAHGVKIIPPDINSSDYDFSAGENGIRFGLMAVKNLGRGVIQAIVDERNANGNYTGISDFIERMYGKEINKRAIEGLIKCGAFDSFPQNRREMLHSYEEISDYIDDTMRRNLEGQMDLFGSQNVQKPEVAIDSMPDFTSKEKLAMEKEVTGMYISGHPLDHLRPPRGSGKITDIITLISDDGESAVADNASFNIFGIIQDKKAYTTKSKEKMLFLTVEDKTASMEVVVFPSAYETYRKCFEGDAPLLISGRISQKEDETAKLICSGVRECGIASEQVGDGLSKLYIKLNSDKDGRLDEVLKILSAHEGENEVRLYFADTKKTVNAKNNGVRLSDDLLKALKTLLGDNNIVTK